MHVENNGSIFIRRKKEQPHQVERLRVKSKGAGALGLRQGKATVFEIWHQGLSYVRMAQECADP